MIFTILTMLTNNKMATLGCLLTIVITLLSMTFNRDKNIIKEKSGEESTQVIFHTHGKFSRVYQTTSGQRWIVTGRLFWTDAFKQE